ncbi:MAG: sugar transferase [Thermoguttaceae bacterium]|jgi:lipopolysaccharide/colanic/teichoic acid biosynthesis glycosyltransferase
MSNVELLLPESIEPDFAAMVTVVPPHRFPLAQPSRRRVRASRAKKRRPPVSLVRRHLDAGTALVRPAGNTALAYRAAKRILDILGALALLILLGPLMLAICAAVCVTTRGRPLFVQRRAGYLGRPFALVKFRTMRPDADRIKHMVKNEKEGPVFKNRHDPRVTRLGRLLRKTSLDETPQLLHVLLGQMSLVGPRPLDVNELVRFEAWQRGRLAVKPGLTCLWQVSGRCEVPFIDSVRMDLWYVRHQNLWTDCALLARTPWSVLSGRGAY